MDELNMFKRFACYICFDAARAPPRDKEELAWDSFQTIYTDIDPTYETPHEGNRYPIPKKGQDSSNLNSFGNSADLIHRTEDPKERDVDHLLDLRTHLRDQLRDLSSESNDEEGNLPKTIGEHQMPHLTAWQSIRNAMAERSSSPKEPSELWSRSPSFGKEPLEKSHQLEIEDDPVRFSHVARLKEYLKLNIQVLQDQIEWNSHKIHKEDWLREQATTMTPIVKREVGTNTEHEEIVTPKQDNPYCLHCESRTHDIYQCRVPGKEKKVGWLKEQETILESLYLQKSKLKESPSDSLDHQRREAIAVARKLTNPLGKHWNAPEKRYLNPRTMEPGHKIKTNTSQSINSGVEEEHSNTYQDAAIAQNTQVRQTEKIKTNTSRDERGTRPTIDPQAMCEIPGDKEPFNQHAHKDPFEQTQYYHDGMFTQGKNPGTKGQLSHKSDSSEELNTPSPSINQDPFNSYGSNKSNSEQTPSSQKDKYVEEKTPQTREQLSPRRVVGISLNEKCPQRNVHFRDPEGEVGRKQYIGVHKPILITPRHLEHESSRGESEGPKRINSPDSPSDPNGRYFSGTVEHGKGGNFYGYYFTPSRMTYPKTQRRFYSSTPYSERSFGDRSAPHRYGESDTSQIVFNNTGYAG